MSSASLIKVRGKAQPSGPIRGRTRVVTAPASSVLKRAEARWSARFYDPGLHGSVLRDVSGNGHHMRLGSAPRSEIIDGQLVIPVGGGTGASWASTPDVTALRTTDIDVAVEVATDLWLNGSTLIGKMGASGARSWRIHHESAPGYNAIRFTWYTDGINVAGVVNSPEALVNVITIGKFKWIRFTFDADNGSAQNVGQWYLSDDGETWTPWGAAVVQAGAQTIGHYATAALEIGAYAGGTSPVYAGRFRRAWMRSSIDGSKVLDIDFRPLKDGTPWLDDATGKRISILPGRSVVLSGQLHLPGLTSNMMKTEAHPDLNVPGDLEIEWHGTIASWTPSTTSWWFNKYGSAGGISWGFFLSSTGTITFRRSLDGTAVVSFASVSQTGTPLSFRLRIRYTAATGAVTMERSNDEGVTWTQFYSGSSTAGAIFATDTPVTLGALAAGTTPLLGHSTHRRAIVRSGINGTAVLDVDFSLVPDGAGVLDPFLDKTGKAVKTLTSAIGVDTNDPTFLPYSGEKYAYSPGVNGAFAQISAAEAPLSTGVIRIGGRFTFDVVNAAQNGLMGRTYEEYHLAMFSGVPRFQFKTAADPATLHQHSATRALTNVISDGQAVWLMATRDPANGEIKFFYSTLTKKPTDAQWIQLGTTIIGATGALQSFGQPFFIGPYYNGTAGGNLTGRMHEAFFDNDGINLVNVDFSRSVEPHATFLARTGQTVMLVRPATGKKLALVDRPMFLFGGDDYAECPDHAPLDFAAAESLTAAVGLRRYGVPTAVNVYLAKKTSTGISQGYALYSVASSANGTLIISDAVVAPVASVALLDGRAQALTGIRSVPADTLTAISEDTVGAAATDTTTGALANAEVLRLGRFSGTGTSYSDMELMATAVWREPLTAADVALLAGEMAAG